MLSFANNHTMDYSYDGLLKTLDAVNQYGFLHSGVGRNLDEAASPAYLDTLSGRVALISVVSTFEPSAMAGVQSRRVQGRPGVNGLRFSEKLTVTPEQMEHIKEIARGTQINVQKDIGRAEGYYPPVEEGCFDLGEMHFEIGEKTGRHTAVNKTDLERIKKTIFDAQLQADYIIVSVHSHELSGLSKENPSDFLVEFSRSCIDSGAHAVIGHGPHLLRPIEIYKRRPIFYSLGDFVLQLENIPYAPEDFYSKYGLTSDVTMHELFKKRSNNFTRGLQTQRVMFETVVPYWEMEDGYLTKLELMPVELGFGLPRSRSGVPAPAGDAGILERLKAMSEPWGTGMDIEGTIGKVLL
jgi:poly-gamma-glutamate synthesis protein (capsule biosynthesis protein)